MWTCPKCNQKFVNTNQWHSCGQNTVGEFLADKTDISLNLYKQLISEFKNIGDFELHPAKTRIALNKNMRFASINKLGKDYLDAHLVFTQRFEDSLCFHKIDTVTDNAHVHHFRLYHKEDITDELIMYLERAYKIGMREHLNKKKKNHE